MFISKSVILSVMFWQKMDTFYHLLRTILFLWPQGTNENYSAKSAVRNCEARLQFTLLCSRQLATDRRQNNFNERKLHNLSVTLFPVCFGVQLVCRRRFWKRGQCWRDTQFMYYVCMYYLLVERGNTVVYRIYLSLLPVPVVRSFDVSGITYV